MVSKSIKVITSIQPRNAENELGCSAIDADNNIWVLVLNGVSEVTHQKVKVGTFIILQNVIITYKTLRVTEKSRICITNPNVHCRPVSSRHFPQRPSKKHPRCLDIATEDENVVHWCVDSALALMKSYIEDKEYEVMRVNRNCICRDALQFYNANIDTVLDRSSAERGVPPAEVYQNGETDEDPDQFLHALHSSVEIFVNRMRSNSQRGRSIATDSSAQSLFNVISNMHPQLLKYIQGQEDLRGNFESLQDKLAQLRDAREALDALREDFREKKRLEMEELERQRQIQMAQKLDIMRQKKHEYLEMQRQLALQRLQEQEREMHMRFEQQRQLTQMRQMQNYGYNQPPYPQGPIPGAPQGFNPVAGGMQGSPVHQLQQSGQGPPMAQMGPQQMYAAQVSQGVYTQAGPPSGQGIYQSMNPAGGQDQAAPGGYTMEHMPSQTGGYQTQAYSHPGAPPSLQPGVGGHAPQGGQGFTSLPPRSPNVGDFQQGTPYNMQGLSTALPMHDGQGYTAQQQYMGGPVTGGQFQNPSGQPQGMAPQVQQGLGPQAQGMSHGQQPGMPPSGQHGMAQPGMTSQGQQGMALQGQQGMAPQGQGMTPQGQGMAPQGQGMAPQGQQGMAPQGQQGMTPQVQQGGMSQGQGMAPQGHGMAPPGQGMAPQGQQGGMAPQGQPTQNVAPAPQQHQPGPNEAELITFD